MSKTILTVDDSSTMRQMVKFTLTEGGYHVVEASDGKEALKQLDKMQVDMVITDINMPEIDGIKLLREIREHIRFRFIPVLLLTTISEEKKKEEGKAAGATGWIVKPFRPEKLLAVVQKVLR